VRRATGKPGVRSNSLEPTQTIWIEDKIVPLSLLEVGHDTSDIGGSFSKRSCVVTAVIIVIIVCTSPMLVLMVAPAVPNVLRMAPPPPGKHTLAV
jgi:hypothetical protein